MENLKFVKEQLKGKKFFGGGKIGYIDVAFDWLNLASIIEEVAGVKLIDEDNFPWLKAWMELSSDVPVIKQSWPDQEKLIINMSPAQEEVKLFRNWSSAYALRIVWALKIKGIEFHTIFEDLENKSPSLLHYNPVHKKVPVLVHNGKPICESLVVLEYIEETWKQNPLLPEDPLDKATARFWAKFNDDKLLPSIAVVFTTQGKEQEEVKVPVMENLKFVDEQLKGKKYFGGEKIGFLDIVFGWLANMASVVEEVAGVQLIDEENFPLLKAWMELFSDTPVIKESWPDREKLIIKYQLRREGYLASSVAK
ncbi:hypothetical protein LguiB_011132 [Lonicera macranthoides]